MRRVTRGGSRLLAGASAVLAVAGGLLAGAPAATAAPLPPMLTASPTSSSASPIVLTANSSAIVTITNALWSPSSGRLAVSLSQSSSSAGFAITANHCAGVTLGRGRTCTVTVSHTPPAPLTAQTATLMVTGFSPFGALLCRGPFGLAFCERLGLAVASYFSIAGAPPVLTTAPQSNTVSPALGSQASGNVLTGDSVSNGDPVTFSPPSSTLDAASTADLFISNTTLSGPNKILTVSSLEFGELGALSVDVTSGDPNFGKYTFTIDPSNGNALQLISDETLVVDVAVADGSVPTITAGETLAITIDATRVVSSGPQAFDVSSAEGTTLTANLLTKDTVATGPLFVPAVSFDAAKSSADLTDVSTIKGTDLLFTLTSTAVGELGTLSVDPSTGAFVFTVDPSNGNADRLPNDRTAVFDVSVASGLTPTNVTSQTLSITISIPAT